MKIGEVNVSAGEVLSRHSLGTSLKEYLRHSSPQLWATGLSVPFSLAGLLLCPSKTLVVGSRLSEDPSLPRFPHFPGLPSGAWIPTRGGGGHIHSRFSRLLLADLPRALPFF